MSAAKSHFAKTMYWQVAAYVTKAMNIFLAYKKGLLPTAFAVLQQPRLHLSFLPLIY